MNEKVRQKVIMSSPIFIFCYFWESFDTLFFEQKSKYIYYTQGTIEKEQGKERQNFLFRISRIFMIIF